MISLDVENYCHECAKFKPECTKLCYDGGKYTTLISCENKGVCANIKLYIEKQMTKEQITCKDCNHNANPPESGNANCNLFYGMTEQYGFCHRAERRKYD